MSLSLFLARRLSLRSASGKGLSGLGIAVTGIALSVIVMFISISVMLGFKQEIRQKIIGFDSQLSISPYAVGDDSVQPLISISDIDDALSSLPEGSSYSLVIRMPALLKTSEAFTGVIIKGVDKNYNWDFLKQNLVDGKMPDLSPDSAIYEVLISRSLARKLDLKPGERFDAFFFGDDIYRNRRLTVCGIYDTHFNEYDENFVFANIAMLSEVGDIPVGKGSQIEINGLSDDEEMTMAGNALSTSLMDAFYSGQSSKLYSITDVRTSAALFFNWLALLDTNVIVILTLMSLLSCLTLVSSLYIIILRRVTMIGILKALGASNPVIRRAFIYLTLKILCIGLVIGNIISFGLVYIQQVTGFIPLDPDAYYLDHVPVLISVPALILLNIGIIIVSALVLILPSAIITTIPPSKVINYE